MAWRKSLFRNILRVSPSGSRFCGERFMPPSCKSLRINILDSETEKIVRLELLVSPMFPIFCPQNLEPVRLIPGLPLTR